MKNSEKQEDMKQDKWVKETEKNEGKKCEEIYWTKGK